MGLWIKNQNKNALYKPEKLELEYDFMCCDEVQLIHIKSDKGILGSYKTEERALEVLGEIEDLLYEYKISIYEMPEE